MKHRPIFPTFSLLIFMFLMLCNIAWIPGILKQKQNKPSKQVQKPKPAPVKTDETIFSVIEIEDLKYPTLETSIRLPYRANPKNSVVLVRNHVYAATEGHLHVIDVSKPQMPSYQTSLAFPDKIGKVMAHENRLVVAGDRQFHIVNISVPTEPVIHSTTKLPNHNRIKDIDINGVHLYVLAEDNYSLYIFSLEYRQARFVKSKLLAKRWWFLSPTEKPPNIQQFLFPLSHTVYSTISEPFLSELGFLQLHPGAHGIIRASTEFLVTNDSTTKANDLPIKLELLRKHVGGLSVIECYYVDESKHAVSSGTSASYNNYNKYYGETFEGGKKKFTRQKPKMSHAIVDGKMQQIKLNPAIETVEIDNKTYDGLITDFQLHENVLYIVKETGFFSIFLFYSSSEWIHGKRDTYLSTTALQANSPISIAVGKQHVYILAMPEKRK